MPRWNTLRWPLGASALAALAIAGCGAAANRSGHRLHAAAEKRLLTLVAHARNEVSDHDRAAAHAVLAQFVSEVSTLRSSGELSTAAAGSLDRQARTAAAHIAERVPSAAGGTHTTATDTAATPSAPAPPVSATTAAPAAAAGNDSMPPIAIPAKHDPGPKVRAPRMPGHSGDHPFGDGNHRFPHGAGDGHPGDWNRGEGD